MNLQVASGGTSQTPPIPMRAKHLPQNQTHMGLDLAGNSPIELFGASRGPGERLASVKTHERRRNLLPKFMPISFFQACISFLRCYKRPGASIRQILVHTGMLPCLVP